MNFRFSDEQLEFRRMLRDWVEKECPKSVARDLEGAEGQYPFELWDSMTAAGFHSIGIDPAYGGQGGSVIDQVLLCAELGRSLAGLTWIWGISSFAGAKSLTAFGSDEQKERFLPDLAEGKLRFAISVTEPGGGTDLLGALRTTAERCDGGWRISGRKIWCTAAAQSDYLLLLLARTDPNPARKSLGTTIFFVPQPSDGLELTNIPKLGMKAVPSYEVYLDRVFVPDDLVLGEPGRGWRQLLSTLNNERILVAALCCGVLEGALEEAVAHLNDREAFGRRAGRVPGHAAQRGEHQDVAAAGRVGDLRGRLAADHRGAMRHRGHDGQGPRLGVRRRSRRPGHPDVRRDGLRHGDTHAALLAGHAHLPDRAHQQRDGPQPDRGVLRPAESAMRRA